MDHNLTYIQWLSIDGQWKKKRKKKRRLDIDQNEEWTRFWLMELFWICFPCGGWDIAWRSVSLCVLTWVHRQEFGDENITSGPSMTQIENTFLSGRCHGALSRQTNKCNADHFLSPHSFQFIHPRTLHLTHYFLSMTSQIHFKAVKERNKCSGSRNCLATY